MYGFAFIRLPNGGRTSVHFNGTRAEAQTQVNEEANRLGGVAPDLSQPAPWDLTDIPIDSPLGRKAAEIFNRAFEKDLAAK